MFLKAAAVNNTYRRKEIKDYESYLKKFKINRIP